MNNIGSQLKELREQNNLTRKEATNRLRELGIDISDKTLYGYESGRNSANADMFLTLCKIYKCNNIMETFSDTIEDVLFTNSEWSIIEKYRNLDDHGRETINIILNRETQRVDMLNKAHEEKAQIIELEKVTRSKYYISYYQRMASAGSGEYLFNDIPTDLIEVLDTPTARSADFVIGINGRSMEPDYQDGDRVFVKKSEEIPTGSIGVFLRGNECFIKELGTDRLISHNLDKDSYPDIPASEDIHCAGLVLGKVED